MSTPDPQGLPKCTSFVYSGVKNLRVLIKERPSSTEMHGVKHDLQESNGACHNILPQNYIEPKDGRSFSGLGNFK